MRIKQTKKPLSKTIYIAIACVAAVGLAVAIYFLFLRPINTPSTDQTGSNNQSSSTTSDGSTAQDVKNNSNSNSTKTAEQIPADKTGSITIVSFDQKNGYVTANATTTNFSTKKCVYSFTTSGGKPVIEEQTGSCSTVTISQDLFDKIGTYTLNVTAYSNSAKITTSKEVDIK